MELELGWVRELANQVPDGEQVVCFGERRPAEEAIRGLETEIQRMLEEGHQVSLISVNLATRSGVAFRPNVPMCTQSTVKAIYVGAMLSQFPDAYEAHEQEIRETIMLSSNEAYESLRDCYGPEPIRAWCRETGVDEGFADLPYPRAYTARDMLKLWTRLYRFLNDGSDVHHVGRFYADSAQSAAKERLSTRCPVHSKAGWENGVGDDETDYEHAVIPAEYVDGDPLNDECAINDTGVVYAEKGPYLFVIYTDYPWPWSGTHPLHRLTEALYLVWS